MLKNKSIFLLFTLLNLFFACSGKNDSEYTTINVDAAYWTIFRGDQNLSGVAKGDLPGKIELLWSFRTEYDVVSSPVINFGNVYIGSTDGKIYSIDLLTGEKVWEFNTEDDIEAPPLLLDKTIYIGNLSGSFFALDAFSGQIKWKYEISGEIMGSANWAAVSNSFKKLVLVGSYDTKMYCFDAETGELKWTYETDYYINGAPATDGQHVVFGGCDEKLHIISVVDGTKKGEVWAGSYIAGSAALVDNRAYVGHYGSKLVCIDLNEQKIVWEYEDKENKSEFFSSPAVGKNRVVIGSRDHFLHCVDRNTGQNIWKFRTRDEIDSSPVIVNDKVVFGSTDGRLYILNLEDGKEIWSYEIGAAILGCPAVTGGMIVIGAKDGSVYAFGGIK
ncbi:PQQ-binding-like beta-propeller repeat protein [candidate division KSB1 bacterium]